MDSLSRTPFVEDGARFCLAGMVKCPVKEQVLRHYRFVRFYQALGTCKLLHTKHHSEAEEQLLSVSLEVNFL
jgi:hypothetical protein